MSMNTATTWPQLLAQTTTTLHVTAILPAATTMPADTGLPATATTDPDGPAARRALGLAVAAGLAHPGADADWDLCTVTVAGARQRLATGLGDPDPLPTVTAAAGGDDVALRHATLGLLRRLAELYQTAADDERANAWRRLVWIDVADRLATAVAELRPTD